jgi:preprotein translocase subunit SecD
MKTIIYLLIAIFTFGIVAGGLTNRASAETRILIQSTDKNVSSVSLSQSAKIISARLKDFSSEKFELTIIPEKNQIQVVLADNQDLKTVGDLIVGRGVIAFYSTYNHERLSELLKEDSQLFSLLKSNGPDRSMATVGCTTVSEVEKVNNYLKTAASGKKCKFAWSPSSGDTDVCLYALRLEGEKGSLLTGSDIEIVKFNKENTSENYELSVEFKKSAVKLWADATRRNINNAIAIVLDNKVIYAPVLRDAIEGGKCSITGNFTKTEVQYLAALCNNGELPLSFKIVK